MNKQCYAILDGQWGSSGKGLLAGYLAREKKPDLVVAQFGPNSGHTYTNKAEGIHVITRAIPTGCVWGGSKLLIGPGAIIDPEVLLPEIDMLEAAGIPIRGRLLIHPRAAVVCQDDKDLEGATLAHIGSTKKGTAAAVTRKMMRPADRNPARVASEHSDLLPFVPDIRDYYAAIAAANVIQVESAQGFELSIDHALEYPYTTGRNITPESVLNDVGIPRRMLTDVWVVLRTFPIRVGNEYDKDGKMIGYSGPVYKEMDELTWEQVSALTGQRLEERTTVTKKVRRVFTWSDEQFDRMLWHYAPCRLFLNFLNYVPENDRNTFINKVRAISMGRGNLDLLGHGPDHNDIKQLGAAL